MRRSVVIGLAVGLGLGMGLGQNALGAQVGVPSSDGVAGGGAFTDYRLINNGTDGRQYEIGSINASYSGHPGDAYYFSAQAVLDGNPDDTCGRISNNVTNRGTANGTCDDLPFAPSIIRSDRFRICRSVNNLPDPCGSWSANSYRP